MRGRRYTYNMKKSIVSKSLISILVGTLVLATPALAGKIYKTINEDGTITYSDTPSPGAIEVDFASNTTTVVQNPTVKTKTNKVITQKPQVQYNLSILAPSPEATIRNTTGNVSISADLSPRAAGHYELSLHDKKLRSSSGSFLIKDLPRGEYSYQINFVATSGKVIASSEVRRFFIHKPSVLIKPQNNVN